MQPAASAIVRGEVVRVMVLFYSLPAWGALGGYLWLIGGSAIVTATCTS